MNEAEKILVEALRSGKYEQTRDWLRVGEEFCCLGVACDVLGQGRWVPQTHCQYYQDGGPNATGLSFNVRARLGWASLVGRVTFHDRNNMCVSLADMNDSGLTFDQIADVIEAGLVEGNYAE